MSLSRDILANLRGFTKAMYATWFYYPPAGVLFDAGEGASTSLANTVFGVRKIFLSHGHYDHIGGLPGIVLARNSAMGEKTLPLTVYHPASDPYIQLQREYIRHLSRGLQYELTWTGLSPDETVPLDAASGLWSVQAFQTRHVRNQTTLGYRLVERRTRLREAYRGLPEPEIVKAVRASGRDAISETYDKVLIAYGGDSLAVDPDTVRGAVLLLHDCTFITPDEREANIHAILDEVLDTAQAAGVRHLGLMHISTRYRLKEIEAHVRKALKEKAFEAGVSVFHGGRVVEIQAQTE